MYIQGPDGKQMWVRVCQVKGCGTPLLLKNGEADFSRTRRFCSRKCKGIDAVDQLREKRKEERAKGHRRCKRCGRNVPVKAVK